MSFLRLDQTTSDWVIFAPSRARRPDEFRNRPIAPEDNPDSETHCPFCPGNEARTPPEIYAERPFGKSTSEWSVRVIPNKFPALRIEEDHRHYDDGEGFRHIGGCGAHEVIVSRIAFESPTSTRVLLIFCRRFSKSSGRRDSTSRLFPKTAIKRSVVCL